MATNSPEAVHTVRTVFAVVRTLETRKYGCIILRKGVVGDEG